MEEQNDFDLEEWRVHPSLNRLRRGDDIARVEPKLMDVLLFLADQPGQVVSKDDIAEAVWPGVFVTESVITRAIAGLRRALEDDARSPRFIETIAKRGYRLLIQPVKVEAAGRPLGGPSAPGTALDTSCGISSQPFVVGPFVVGQWVRGDLFYGREAEIREILKGPRNGIWLLGSRAVGKTSVLKQLEHLTAEDGEGGYFPLFWDLQGSAEPEDLHRDFATALADAEDRLELLGLPLEEVRGEDFFRSIGRLRRGLRSRGRTLLLLWDEVEELVNLHGRWPVLLRKLRRALQSQEGIRTVLASGPGLWQLAAQRGDTSPFLHGFAPPLYLGPLGDGAAEALVGQVQAPGSPAPIRDAATVRELLRRCGNHPSLLQLLCMRFLESGELETATEAVTADLTVHYFFSVDFDSLTPLEQEIQLRLAAHDTPTPAGELGLSSPASEIASRLLHLERLGQIRRFEDGTFAIASAIHCHWLRQRAAASG